MKTEPLLDILEFLGEPKYYIKQIDCEDCICRKIGNYEIELSNCDKPKMSVNLYVWELTEDGTPAQIVLDKCGITSKQRLKDIAEYIASNIDKVIQCGSLDAALSK